MLVLTWSLAHGNFGLTVVLLSLFTARPASSRSLTGRPIRRGCRSDRLLQVCSLRPRASPGKSTDEKAIYRIFHARFLLRELGGSSATVELLCCPEGP